jgi:VanZ family protein
VDGGGRKAEKRRSRTWAESPFRLPLSSFRLFLYYWLPLIAYGAFIAIQSHFPSPDSVPRLPFFDKLLHTGAYALLGMLFCRAYRSGRPAASARSLARAAVLSAVLFGLTDEIHQSYVPSRTADGWDLLADALGAAMGVGFYFALISLSGPRPGAKRIDKEDAFG